MKNVLVVGYGAVGAIYALVLKRSGMARVTVVARSNYAITMREGMHIRSLKYGDYDGWRPDRLCASVAEATNPPSGSSASHSNSSQSPASAEDVVEDFDRPYDYVVLATKALPELAPAQSVLAPLWGQAYRERMQAQLGKLGKLGGNEVRAGASSPATTYVLLQNGLGVEDGLYDALKAAGPGPDTGTVGGGRNPRVVSSALWIGTNLVGENVVQHNDFDRMTIGMYKPDDFTSETYADEEEKAILDDFAGLLAKGGSKEVTVVPEIQRVKFRKNFWNLAFASFASLSGHPLPAIFQAPPALEARVVHAIRAVLEEVLAVGRAMGFDERALPASVVDETIERTAAIHRRADSRHRPSMLLDRECGRPMEVEVIVGEVVRRAEVAGVDVPRIETLYALLSIIQGQLVRKV